MKHCQNKEGTTIIKHTSSLKGEKRLDHCFIVVSYYYDAMLHFVIISLPTKMLNVKICELFSELAIFVPLQYKVGRVVYVNFVLKRNDL